MKKPFVLAAIFARGGSKGIPHKNIKMLAGKPLMAYAIEVAQALDEVSVLMVSTDDEAIAQVARHYGAAVPFMRPKHLATDDAPEYLAWRHALTTYQEIHSCTVDVLLSIPTTSPLRHIEDVQRCLALLLSDPQLDGVVAVTEAKRSPYFNMVQQDSEGYIALAVEPQQTIYGRQKAPCLYDMTTISYAVRAPFVMEHDRLLSGKIKAIVVPEERALDIDTPLDFEIAEYLMARTKKALL